MTQEQPISRLLLSFKVVFSKWMYCIVAGSIGVIFWIIFNVFEQLLFFTPVLIFYLPSDGVVSFILTNIISILLGIVVSMNIYVIRHSRLRVSFKSFISGSGLSILSSTCASCSSLGFLLISIFGGAGLATSTFFIQLSNTYTYSISCIIDMGIILYK
jgi:hypothetical protein